MHTGERPYACKYCERTFTNYPNWLKHTRRRHKVDHKTGEELVPKDTVKTPKIEAPPTPVSNHSDIHSTTNNSDHLLTTDFTLSKTEEIGIEEGLLNFPLTSDDKFLLQQEIFNTSSKQ